jgi:hypothetical protein
MPFICNTVTTYVEKTVLEPVDKWVAEKQKQCKSQKWPKNWLCWFITVLVKVVVWITRKIVVPMTTVVCKFVSWTLYFPAWPIAWIIDQFCAKCHALDWLKDTLTNYIKFKDKKDSSTPGHYDYIFICNCPKGPVEIVVTAKDDEEAAQKAKEVCATKC